MGDQIGQAVEGTLYYAPYREFERVRAISEDRVLRASLFADMCRLNALYMIAFAGSGHIGSSFSSLDIVSWLLLEELRGARQDGGAGDIYFSSKGHDAPGYYSALLGMGRLPFELIHRLRRANGLPGHPDVSTPGIVTNTGSLGMGVSKAKGFVHANRLQKRSGRVFVMTGDGELQEGQFWESLVSAANEGCHEITVIVDNNKLQSDTFVSNVSDLGDLESKLASFGWLVERCDGHDLNAFSRVLDRLDAERQRPKIIIADTIKGKGVSFMEHTALDSDVAMYRFHSGAPDAQAYQRAAQEIIDRIGDRCRTTGTEPVLFEKVRRDSARPPAAETQRLVAAYSRALVEQAARNENLVALDADLVLDTGLIPFRDRFPDRFFECGIAEQDMVSQAAGMALNGLLPVVHSFACFLSTRPNEQIYNQLTERTKVIYVGSLAGVLPGGPGHSHQSVRDISALAGNPGLTMIEPCDEDEVGKVLDHCVKQEVGSSYLRLVSIPCEIPYRLPPHYRLERGRGVVLREGADAAIIGYGPTLLSQAYRAAEILADRQGKHLAVINLPWLNHIDTGWLTSVAEKYSCIFSLDNHYMKGGQGEMIGDRLAQLQLARHPRLVRFGLQEIPICGQNDEVLRAHGLDAESLAKQILMVLAGSERQ